MKELEYTTQSVPKDKRFCTICGKVKRLRYFEGDSTHCSECCEKMLHTKPNGYAVPVLLAVLLVAAASVILSVQTVPYCAGLFRADAARRDNRLADACAQYSDVISEASERNTALLTAGKDAESGETPTKTFFEAGTTTWIHYLETYGALYSEYEAASLAENSLSDRASSDFRQIAQLSEAKTAYEQTDSFMQDLDMKYVFDSSEDMPYESIIDELTAFADESDSRYIKGYVEYYKGSATMYFKPDDPAAATAYFEKMLEYLPDEFMAAYTAEADAAINAKDYETAIETYEKILAKNKNYTDAYPAIAEAAFFASNDEKLASALAQYDEDDPARLWMEMRFALRSDDLDKAAEVHERAQKTAKVQADQIFNKMLADQTLGQEDKEKLLSYVEYALYDAAYSLVQGDTDAAYQTAYEEAFNYVYYYAYLTNDSSGFSQSNINMATLTATLDKQKDSLETVRQVGDCDSATQKIIDGELTVRDVFVEGKAEIL